MYRTEFCDQLIDHMTKGLTFATFGAVAGVSRKTLYQWVDKYPDFEEAKSIGTAHGQLFYEQRLVALVSGQQFKGINTKDINASALIFGLKTRFHKTYGEKKEYTHDIVAPQLLIDMGDDEES